MLITLYKRKVKSEIYENSAHITISLTNENKTENIVEKKIS